jgi:hypothetical protein
MKRSAQPGLAKTLGADTDPDVWWGEQGIDALLLPPPYSPPETAPVIENSTNESEGRDA